MNTIADLAAQSVPQENFVWTGVALWNAQVDKLLLAGSASIHRTTMSFAERARMTLESIALVEKSALPGFAL